MIDEVKLKWCIGGDCRIGDAVSVLLAVISWHSAGCPAGELFVFERNLLFYHL
jgi:hypothetical protein